MHMRTEMPPMNEGSLGANAGTTSAKKIEANRQNAQSSTGPKTLEGKKTVSRNARTHGLLAKDVVITTGDRKEDQAEFDAMLAGLRDNYKPIGIAEDLLVQELAVSYWRSARALRCEKGELSIREVRPLTELELSMIALQADDEARYELLRNSRGLQYVIQKVQEVRQEMEHSGGISWDTSQWLSRHLGGSWDAVSTKQAFLAALDAKTAELRARKVMIEENELDFSSIPRIETLNRITRYETTNVRHRERVMQMLERCQSQRKQNQESVPVADDDDGEEPQNN
jgi:hypothetical protein